MNGFVEAAMMMNANVFYDLRPNELEGNNVFQRVFNQDCPDDELVWHRDKRDRVVKVISGVNWKFQFDNQLPVTLKVGERFVIERETYHRILKGDGKLILEIEEK